MQVRLQQTECFLQLRPGLLQRYFDILLLITKIHSNIVSNHRKSFILFDLQLNCFWSDLYRALRISYGKNCNSSFKEAWRKSLQPQMKRGKRVICQAVKNTARQVLYTIWSEIVEKKSSKFIGIVVIKPACSEWINQLIYFVFSISIQWMLMWFYIV